MQEIGGSRYWQRRGTIELEIFFTQEDYTRDEARHYANVIRRRVEYIMDTGTTARGITDDFGETCLMVKAKKSWLLEGGGSGKFIWRGWVYWEALTHASY